MLDNNVFNFAQIDNGIEYALMKAFVDAGYWVLPSNYIGDEAGFNAAIQALPTKIEVFGPGSKIEKGEINDGNVYIRRMDIEPGSVRYPDKVNFVKQGLPTPTDNYKKYLINDTLNIEYQIRFMTEKAAIERIISQIILSALGVRKYIPGTQINGTNDDYEFTSFFFPIHFIPPSLNVDSEHYKERIYRYEVRDVNVIPDIEIDTVPEITQINVEIQPTIDTAGIDIEDETTFPGDEVVTITEEQP